MESSFFSKKILPRVTSIIISLMAATILGGCTSSEEIYYSIKNYSDTSEQQLQDLANGENTVIDLSINDIGNAVTQTGINIKHSTGNFVTKIGLWADKYWFTAILVCWVIGGVILLATIKSPAIKLRQMTIGVLIVGIPLLILIGTVLLGIISAGLLS